MSEKALSSEDRRIRDVYTRRDQAGKSGLYAWHRQEVLLNTYRFRSVAASLLTSNGIMSMAGLNALDVGCGTGGWLRTLMEWGAEAEQLHGIDLLEDRIEKAKKLSPVSDFRVASGYQIPYSNESMDLLSANTVFSSILDGVARKALAQEMIRVMRPAGAVFIYDFRISHPRNPDTVGIRKSEIQRLFPDFKVKMRSLTLAPPFARRIAPISPLLAHFLEASFPFLRTHAVYLLRR